MIMKLTIYTRCSQFRKKCGMPTVNQFRKGVECLECEK